MKNEFQISLPVAKRPAAPLFLSKNKWFFLFLIICFSNNYARTQTGCTDPQALNFDPDATENDGSCAYPTTNYTPLQLAILPASLDECSGLAFFADRLWTHEDGGSLDQLFVLDSLTGEILQTVTLPNADNLDWEDLAEDDEHLYIGDFGNNQGNRTDLNILKYKKSDLLAGTALPEIIEFSYSDQTDFTPAPNANDYDCEAFFFWNDSLHLFSKNWLNFKTRHYVLPATPGTHVAQLRDSLAVQGQITGADITGEGVATLLGYNVGTGDTFLWLLFDFTGNDFFGGNKRKIALGSALFNSQPEGIVFRNEHYGYICSERYSALPQKLLAFDVLQWIENTVHADEHAAPVWSVSPNPFENSLTIDFQTFNPGDVEIKLLDARGIWLKSRTLPGGGRPVSVQLQTGDLPPGLYFLTVRQEGKIFTKTLFRR